jgi:hypothetical protein
MVGWLKARDRRGVSAGSRPYSAYPASILSILGTREMLRTMHGMTRTEPAIFTTYVHSSKQTFDSPCNLRTSRSLRCAIFVRALIIASGTHTDHSRSTAPSSSSTAHVSLARRPGLSKLALGTVDNSW